MGKAQHFFENFLGEAAVEFALLPQSGSSRKNFIAKGKSQTFIITQNENLSENECFLYFSTIFSDLKLNTPKIFAISEDRKMYIQEYLGGETLSEIIEKEGTSERVKLLVKKTLENLFMLQQETKNRIDYSKTFEYEAYNEIPVSHDLYYFKFFFADVLEVQYHKSSLLKEFQNISKKIEKLQPKGLMIRDFQARNIMVNADNEVFFIDYQSAMEGPMMYDVVSLLYQAKAGFSEDFQQEMIGYYIDLFESPVEKQQLQEAIVPIRLMRNLQVLGAYGFRGLVQKKPHFIQSIPKGLLNLQKTSESWEEIADFPELKKLIYTLNTEETAKKIRDIINQ